jgi:chromosome segregation ATPase
MQFKAALSENAALRCQLEQSYALCEQLREQLLAQLQAAEERLNTVTRDFQFQIETLTSSARNDSITREIQANEITALSRQLKREQEKNAAKKELETRCRDLQDRIDYLEDMENRNTLELAGLRARVAEADASASTIANLRSTVDALQKQTTSLSRQLEESRRQYAETMSQLVGISQAAGGK